MSEEASPLDESVQAEMAAFLRKKRAVLDASNQEEFIETLGATGGAARTATRRLDKDVHIPASIVDNQDGPLSRSVLSTTGKLVSPHGVIATGSTERPVFNALEERVRNIETHFGIVVAPIDRSLAERVKALEDKILKVEQMYPQIAARVFNYGRAEVEASLRPGGRVSRLPGPASNKKRPREEARPDRSVSSDLSAATAAASAAEDSSLGELKRRMDELKHRLLKSAKP